mgnify:CR=1 FL=1
MIELGHGRGSNAGRLATGAWPDVLPEWIDHVGRQAYPTLRPANVVAVVMVISPYLTHPVRMLGRWIMGAAAVTPIMLELSTFTGALGAVALGALCVALVRVIVGSPEGLPPLSRLVGTLERVGVPTASLAYLPEQSGTVGRATARVEDLMDEIVVADRRPACRDEQVQARGLADACS